MISGRRAGARDRHTRMRVAPVGTAAIGRARSGHECGSDDDEFERGRGNTDQVSARRRPRRSVRERAVSSVPVAAPSRRRRPQQVRIGHRLVGVTRADSPRGVIARAGAEQVVLGTRVDATGGATIRSSTGSTRPSWNLRWGWSWHPQSTALDHSLLDLVDDLAALAGVRVDPVYPLVVHLQLEVLGPAAVAAKPAPNLGGALHHDDSIGPRPRRA